MYRIYCQYKHFIQLLSLIVISAFFVYYLPPSINKLAFLILLIPVWKSRNDFFWFAYIFVLVGIPGGLFSGGKVDDPYRLPIYNLSPNVSFSFVEIYIILLLLKSILKDQEKRYKTFIYRKQYAFLASFLVILIIMSFLLGMSLTSVRDMYKTVLKISLFYSVIFVFTKEDEITSFFKAIFPFSFIALILQIYGLIFNQQLVALFKPNIILTQGVLTGELLRPIELAVVVLLCFFGSLLYIGNRYSPFSKIYLIAINITCFISILMTATRSWFLGFLVMYIFYILLNYRRVAKSVLYFAIGIIVFLLVLLILPQVKNQINQAAVRLVTVEELAKGDLTAGGTMSRLTERGPRVMEGFNRSTIILGAGFSDSYYDYADGHVGYQNILLNTGIIGFILFLYIAGKLFFKPLRVLKKHNLNSSLKNILRNLPLLILGVLVINSGTQFWGYDLDEISRFMLLAFYISISSKYIYIYITSSYSAKQSKLLSWEEN